MTNTISNVKCLWFGETEKMSNFLEKSLLKIKASPYHLSLVTSLWAEVQGFIVSKHAFHELQPLTFLILHSWLHCECKLMSASGVPCWMQESSQIQWGPVWGSPVRGTPPQAAGSVQLLRHWRLARTHHRWSSASPLGSSSGKGVWWGPAAVPGPAQGPGASWSVLKIAN